jgi:uncharacterized protein YuzE
MKLSYDVKANIAYLRFHESHGTVTTLNIDLAADGSIYGIELLNANQQLAEDHGRLIVESGGRRQEIELAA